MFLLNFLRTFGVVLLYISPVLLTLGLIIVLLGLRVAKIEGWSRSLGIYCAFITATTVGYGVVHPTKARTRSICVLIAFIGLIFTGIMVALAYQSLLVAANSTGLMERLLQHFAEGSGQLPG